jgi:hypothetical protein
MSDSHFHYISLHCQLTRLLVQHITNALHEFIFVFVIVLNSNISINLHEFISIPELIIDHTFYLEQITHMKYFAQAQQNISVFVL